MPTLAILILARFFSLLIQKLSLLIVSVVLMSVSRGLIDFLMWISENELGVRKAACESQFHHIKMLQPLGFTFLNGKICAGNIITLCHCLQGSYNSHIIESKVCENHF